jgi:VCBS repeat-containing protein
VVAGLPGPFVVGTPFVIDSVGTLTIAADGAYSFVPAADANGVVPPITYTVADGSGATTTSTLQITVRAVDDAPVASAAPIVTPEDTSATGTIVATDPDSPSLTYVVVTPPSHGQVSLAADGSFVYVPALDYHGADSFVVRVSDGQGATVDVTVPVTVTPVDDAPVALDDRFDTDADTPLVLALPENDRDADGLSDAETLRVTHIDGVALAVDRPVDVPGGQVRLEADGRVVFVPAADFTGDVRFTYTVTDASGLTATAAVSGTVHPRLPSVPGAPMGWSDPFETPLRRDATAPIAVAPPLLEAVNAIRSLRGVAKLDVQAPLIDAVNGLRPLDGLHLERGSPTPVLDEAERLARSTPQADATRQLYDRGNPAASVRGFEVVRDGLERALRVVPTLDIAERDGWIYAMFDDDGARSEYRLTMRDGRALPAWIVDSHQGHLMIDAALAPPGPIGLRVHVLRVDAAVDAFDLVIDRAAQRVQILHTDPRNDGRDRSLGFAGQISLQARGAQSQAAALATLLRSADTVEPLPTPDR